MALIQVTAASCLTSSEADTWSSRDDYKIFLVILNTTLRLVNTINFAAFNLYETLSEGVKE